jgi:hypothetical protein
VSPPSARTIIFTVITLQKGLLKYGKYTQYALSTKTLLSTPAYAREVMRNVIGLTEREPGMIKPMDNDSTNEPSEIRPIENGGPQELHLSDRLNYDSGH